MKKGRLLLLAIAVLLNFSPAWAQDETLVLWHANGKTTEIQLYTCPTIYFTADKLVIKSPVLNLEYDAADVLRFTHKGVKTAIVTPTDNTVYRIESGRLVFNNLKPTDRVAVYTVDGMAVPTERHGATLSVAYSSIPRGVYVVTINDQSIKFVKP